MNEVNYERYYSLVNGRPNPDKYVDVMTIGANKTPAKRTHRERSLVQRVVYNDPATIIFWKDGTKTVVKKQEGDVYDAEKGFMAAYLKKMLGNDNQYNYEIKWFVPKQSVEETA